MMVEFGAAIGGLRTAVEIVRGLAAADQAINEADLKLKLLGAVNDIVTAQQALMDARLALEERDAEVVRLQGALAIKSEVRRVRSAYFDVGEDGLPHGDGYCLRCYEVDHKLYHLAYGRPMMSEKVICPVCKTDYVYAGVRPE